MSRAEWLAWWSGWWAVGFTILAALAGLIAWYWGNRAASEHEERTRLLEFNIAEQQERAAKAEMELLKIKERMTDRDFTGEERNILIAALKDGPRCRVDVIGGVGGDEMARFQEKVLAIFHQAGWQALPFTIAQTNLATGLGIATPTGALTPCAATISKAFEAVGMKPRLWKASGHSHPPGADFVELLVGPKPVEKL